MAIICNNNAKNEIFIRPATSIINARDDVTAECDTAIKLFQAVFHKIHIMYRVFFSKWRDPVAICFVHRGHPLGRKIVSPSRDTTLSGSKYPAK